MSEIQKAEQGFAIAALEVGNIQEIIRDNLGPMGKVQFERVKMPSGGGLAFEVSDEDGNPQAKSEIVGIIVDHYPVNAYWPEAFGGGSTPPACSALDGRNGIGEPGGLCARCPHNQWGSDDEGRGKACKNLHRLYVLPVGEILPMLIAAPPTSLTNISSYMRLLTSKAKKPHWAVLTRIKPEKASNKDGVNFSRATFTRVGNVQTERLAELKKYIEELKPLMRAVEIASDDYNVTDTEADSADPNQPF